MKRTLILLLLLLTTAVAGAQDDFPDADGDGTPDLFDSCADQAGTAENSGCPDGVTPDFDKDGISDFEDLCYDVPGDPTLLGCTPETFPDVDGDGVADYFDACLDQPGGSDNSGCPAGITPDLDRDGIADSEDACPTVYGEIEFNGCLPDNDGDTIPNSADACPDEAGTTEFYGCAGAGSVPDSDGDTVPDLFDTCPNEAGDPSQSGCLDSDADNLADSFDLCPNEQGSREMIGCPTIETGTLPANRAPINNSNAAAMTEVSRLSLGAPLIALDNNGRLASRAGERVLIYDLNTPDLTVLAQAVVGVSGAPIAYSSDGRFLVTTEFPPDFSGPAFAQARDGQTAAPLQAYTAASRDGMNVGVGEVDFNPVAPVLAAIEDAGMGYDQGYNSVVSLYDLDQGQRVGEITLANASRHVAFSPDGARLAFDTSDGSQLQIELWDVASLTQTQVFPTSPITHFMGTPMAFSPDGAFLAYGTPDGTVVSRNLNAGADNFNAQVFNREMIEVVSAIAYSPDGSLIAAAGGVAFSGGLTGSETFAVVLLDAATGTELTRITTDESLITNLGFSPDGTLLMSTAAVTLRFYGIPQ